MKNIGKNNLWIVSSMLIVVSVVVVIVFFYLEYLGNKSTHTAQQEVGMATKEKYYEDYTKITYQGESYVYNADIKTILFMGINQTKQSGDTEKVNQAGTSDVMILMIVNTKENTVSLLHIPGDTITEIEMVNDMGERIAMDEAQLAMQYTYGGGMKSCQLTRKAVSKLLYGIPVNYYIVMDLDGLSTAIEAVDGITISLDEDYTYIDERLKIGEVIAMDGELGEYFIGYSDTNERGINDTRMARQEMVAESLLEKLTVLTVDNQKLIGRMWYDMKSFFTTDLNVGIVAKIAACKLEEKRYKVPGETAVGTKCHEYIVDDVKLQNLIIELLYHKKQV